MKSYSGTTVYEETLHDLWSWEQKLRKQGKERINFILAENEDDYARVEIGTFFLLNYICSRIEEAVKKTQKVKDRKEILHSLWFDNGKES